MPGVRHSDREISTRMAPTAATPNELHRHRDSAARVGREAQRFLSAGVRDDGPDDDGEIAA